MCSLMEQVRAPDGGSSVGAAINFCGNTPTRSVRICAETAVHAKGLDKQASKEQGRESLFRQRRAKWQQKRSLLKGALDRWVESPIHSSFRSRQ